MDYIGRDNPAAAIRLDLEIDEQVRQLERFPELGRIGRESGTRELVIDRTPFIAVYTINAATIRIVRLLHGAQMFP
jgi:addiction module RelE/StbE family toxin